MKTRKSLAMVLALVLALVQFGMLSSFALAEEDWKTEHPTWLTGEKVTLTVATYDKVASGYPAPSNDQWFWQWLEDYTNVHIEWQTIWDVSSWTEASNAKVASGVELEDIYRCSNVATADSAGENGYLIDLRPYLDAGYFDNTLAYMETVDIDRQTYYNHMVRPDGTMYGFGAYSSANTSIGMFMYNKHWQDALNGTEDQLGILMAPTTVEELYDLCVAMKEAGDWNGNGLDDEVILTAGGGINGLLNHFQRAYGGEGSAPYFCTDENGVVYSDYASDSMKHALQLLNKMWNEGILDPEIFTMSSSKLCEKIGQGQVGIFCYTSSFATTYGSAFCPDGEEDPFGEHYSLGMPFNSSEYGTTGGFLLDSFGYGAAVGVSSSCEYPEIACKWLDVLMGDMTCIIARTRGEEGVNWEYDADGNVQLIMPEDGSTWSIADKGCGEIVLPHVQTQEQILNGKRAMQWYIDEFEYIQENATKIRATYPKTAWYSDEENEAIDLYYTDFTTYFDEMKVKFITGELNFEEDWDDYAASLDDYGQQELLAAYQSVYDRQHVEA